MAACLAWKEIPSTMRSKLTIRRRLTVRLGLAKFISNHWFQDGEPKNGGEASSAQAQSSQDRRSHPILRDSLVGVCLPEKRYYIQYYESVWKGGLLKEGLDCYAVGTKYRICQQIRGSVRPSDIGAS